MQLIFYKLHSPVAMGICSAIIPGLGQVVSGEAGRGIAQFLGEKGLLILAVSIAETNILMNGNEEITPGAAFVAMGCYLGALTIDIVSIVDAVRIAKVKNMYKEDLKQCSLNVSVSPYYDVLCMDTNRTPMTGMTLRISF